MKAIMLAPSVYQPPPSERPRWHPWLCGALCCMAGLSAAQSDNHLPTGAGPAITLRSQTYPDMGAPGPNQTAAHDSIHYTDITGWLTPRQASSLGLTLGVVSQMHGAAVGPQAYDLGVRWRSQLDSRVQLDIHAWARTSQRQARSDALGMILYQDQPAFGTRVEVQWRTSRTHGLAPEFGAIGLELGGNSRLLLRAKRGGPMLYYRAKF